MSRLITIVKSDKKDAYIITHDKLYFIKIVYTNGLISFNLFTDKTKYKNQLKIRKGGSAHYISFDYGEVES